MALISYMDEAVLRVKKPLDVLQQGIEDLAGQVKSGDYDAEDIRMQLQIYANNLNQIAKNLDELSQKAAAERGSDIPPEFRDFFIGR